MCDHLWQYDAAIYTSTYTLYIWHETFKQSKGSVKDAEALEKSWYFDAG